MTCPPPTVGCRAVGDLRDRPEIPLFGLGLGLFFLAVLASGTLLYGLADLVFAAGLVALLNHPVARDARSPELYRAGAILGAVCAGLDGVLTLGDATGSVTSLLTIGILAGFVGICLGALRD